MGKKGISVWIIACILGFMLGAYGTFPWYSMAIEFGEGYVKLDGDTLYESAVVSEKEELLVYFSEDIRSRGVERVLPKIFPLAKGTEMSYPVVINDRQEKMQIWVWNRETDEVHVFADFPTWIFSEKEKGKDNGINEVFCTAESPCFEIGPETIDLADCLWEQSEGNEKIYVEMVYQYLIKMQYDYETANASSDEDRNRYFTRMDLDAVIKKKKAVCRGKANIMAAMLRLKGIPCKVVIGKFEEQSVDGHAWNEVYVSDTWIMFDATTSMMGPPSGERKDKTRFIPYWCY